LDDTAHRTSNATRRVNGCDDGMRRYKPTLNGGVQFIARLAADGLWVYESPSSTVLSTKARQQVAEHLVRVIDPTLVAADSKPARRRSRKLQAS
jgi:hypothetical protein